MLRTDGTGMLIMFDGGFTVATPQRVEAFGAQIALCMRPCQLAVCVTVIGLMFERLTQMINGVAELVQIEI